MNCKNCGASLSNNMLFCSQCGQKATQSNKSLFSRLKNKKFLSIVIICLFALALIIILYNLLKPERSETLMSMPKNDYYKFTINGKDYFLGDKITSLKSNLNYDTNFKDIVYSDSISTRAFFNSDGKEQFLAAVYCSKDNDCAHDDTVLVKANFYDNTPVVVNDFIKKGVTYEEVVEEYGKENGYFYQDEEMLVWAFGNKIGDPYYILRFDNSSIFSSNDIIEIRIGVWWYGEEYQHTVITKQEDEVKN